MCSLKCTSKLHTHDCPAHANECFPQTSAPLPQQTAASSSLGLNSGLTTSSLENGLRKGLGGPRNMLVSPQGGSLLGILLEGSQGAFLLTPLPPLPMGRGGVRKNRNMSPDEGPSFLGLRVILIPDTESIDCLWRVKEYTP